MRNLVMSKSPKVAIFSDFDETYYPHKALPTKQSGIKELENFLENLNQTIDFVFGWVSGANINSILAKGQNYVNLLPHFISSSLGTELYWCESGELQMDNSWQKICKHSGFSETKIAKLIQDLKERKINIYSQPQDAQGIYKSAHYYCEGKNTSLDLEAIRQIAQRYLVNVHLGKCNPESGDPEGHYNVNFTPNNCGKAQIIGYILTKLKIDEVHTIAFGDSCNDIEMLEDVQYGYLVANCDYQARNSYPNILEKQYCFGIKEGITKALATMNL